MQARTAVLGVMLRWLMAMKVEMRLVVRSD